MASVELQLQKASSAFPLGRLVAAFRPERRPLHNYAIGPDLIAPQLVHPSTTLLNRIGGVVSSPASLRISLRMHRCVCRCSFARPRPLAEPALIMTYATIESSTAEGRPYFLYQFVEGDLVWRFTSRATDWTSPASGAAISSGRPRRSPMAMSSRRARSNAGGWRSRFRCRIPSRGGSSRRWATRP